MEHIRLGRISDASITTALLHLRAEIIREDQEGLAHVEALLRLRGVDPAHYHVPQKVPKHFARNKLRTALLRTLREGPKTGPELAQAVAGQNPGLTYKQAYKRVYVALHAMQRVGLVAHSGRIWALSP